MPRHNSPSILQTWPRARSPPRPRFPAKKCDPNGVHAIWSSDTTQPCAWAEPAAAATKLRRHSQIEKGYLIHRVFTPRQATWPPQSDQHEASEPETWNPTTPL